MSGRKKGQLQDLLDSVEPPVIDAQTVTPPPAEGSRPRPLPEAAAPPRLLPPAGRDEGTLVGQGVTLEGTLRFRSRARIDGVFHGKIAAGARLEVGADADVEATVAVDTLLIQGRISGDVDARESVEIEAGGRMKGDIRTPAFQVHRGAFFNGHCEMGEG